jgi:hypothetical protein
MWTLERYRTWLERKKNWFIPGGETEGFDAEVAETSRTPTPLPPNAPKSPATTEKAPPAAPGRTAGGRLEIEPEEGAFGKILKR